MEEPMNKRRLPQTDSIQELASFWDTHDVTEFEDELEEVSEPVFQRETEITVHLETDFSRPISYGDNMEVEVSVQHVGRT